MIRSSSLFVLLALLSSCKGDNKGPAPTQITLPGNASKVDIGTKVGNGRVIDVASQIPPTSTQWTRIYPIDKNAFFMGGHVPGEAFALYTDNRGSTWKSFSSKADGIVTWSVGTDGTAVMTIAKREIPKKPLPPGVPAPIEAWTVQFARPDQPQITTPTTLLPIPGEPTDKPVIPFGDGLPAVLAPNLASVVLQLKPKSYVIAYASGPTDPFPQPIPLPANEVPINAPFGHPAQLLTTNGKQLFIRPWPKPTDVLATPRTIDGIVPIKGIEIELSSGPECEWGGWSFKRVTQDKGKVVLLGISPEKSFVMPMLDSVLKTSPLGCSPEKIIFEYTDENDKIPHIGFSTFDGTVTKPKNKPFLTPWSEDHTRKLFLAPTTAGMIGMQQRRAKFKWSIEISESVDGGLNFQIPRPVGEGEGGNPEDGYEIGALVNLGDRSLIVLSSKVSLTTKRSWYVMASDDNGNSWTMP